jgi:hypothetical protein
MAQSEPTISSILLELAEQYDGIVAEREILDRVLARRPSQAKDPYASIRSKLRFDGAEIGWVRLGGGELIPLRVVLRGLRFRVIPDSDELAQHMLAYTRLIPFVSLRARGLRLEDAEGRALISHDSSLPIGEGLFGAVSVPAFSLGDWLKRVGFELGDSIIATIQQLEPLTLRLEHEPAAAFRVEQVQAQERELIDAIAEQVLHGRTNMLSAWEVVLPIYARAPWRSSYPGRPWQQLVAADHRLRLIDQMYLADSHFRRPLDLLFGDEQDEQRWAEIDQELLEEISALQGELLASRREAAGRGIWNGIAPRASTGRVIFDMRAGTSQVIHPGTVDALQDHSADIEEHVARGDYAGEEWDEDLDPDEDDDMDFDPDAVDDDDLFDIEDIEDMQEFMEQNPALVEATQKLMASLSPEEVERLETAETPDEVQRILTSHLNDLLGKEPALFATLTPALPTKPNSNGHGNGNGDGLHVEDEIAFEGESEWIDAEADDEEWDELEDEELEEINQVIEHSNELMERFYQKLVEQGKSEATAASRTGDLWIYADFLSSYYNRGLEQGDYATLDECLFFFYPRKVMNSSARAARELCTSIKQFYAFLRAESAVADDSFAQAIWRRRDQAARVVELYERINADSPEFERLFAHLFSPYTA